MRRLVLSESEYVKLRDGNMGVCWNCKEMYCDVPNHTKGDICLYCRDNQLHGMDTIRLYDMMVLDNSEVYTWRE